MGDEAKGLVIAGILAGKTLVEVSREIGVTSEAVYRWSRVDPVFARDLADARTHVSHDLVDSLITIADSCNDLTDVGIAKLKSDNIKWLASKRAPQVYGDRIDVNVNQTVDLSQVLRAAESRTIPLLEAKQRIIDSVSHTPIEVIDVDDE